MKVWIFLKVLVFDAVNVSEDSHGFMARKHIMGAYNSVKDGTHGSWDNGFDFVRRIRSRLKENEFGGFGVPMMRY